MTGWVEALMLLGGLLCLLLAAGLPVAFAFLGVNIVGAVVFLGGEAGLHQMVRNTASSVTSFALTPIPLFVLMGEVLFHTGVAFRAIGAIETLIARVPGRLSVVSIVGGTFFAALSGSSIANTALLGGVLLPEKLKRGYDPALAMGSIMAVGGIAMLIPPSALAVLLGSLAGISIAELLIGGILPGLLMGAAFLGYVIIRAALNPALAPGDAMPALAGWARWRPFVLDVMPLFTICFVVVGSILLGWATPTESAAFGAVAAVIAAAAYGALGRSNLLLALTETAKISVMILFIIVASTTFSQILAFSGAVNGVLDAIGSLQLTRFAVVVLMQLVLLVLGCFVDQVSMIMITLPFFVPLAKAMGIDLLWLGVLTLITMEISFITPPFGLILFVMKGVAPPGITMGQIYRAALPFLALEIAVLALLMLVPSLALWLPLMIRPA